MPKRAYRMDVPRTDFNATHMPTPDEIRRECAKIQKTWDEAEREKRLSSAYRRVPASFVEAFEYQQGRHVHHSGGSNTR